MILAFTVMFWLHHEPRHGELPTREAPVRTWHINEVRP